MSLAQKDSPKHLREKVQELKGHQLVSSVRTVQPFLLENKKQYHSQSRSLETSPMSQVQPNSSTTNQFQSRQLNLLMAQRMVEQQSKFGEITLLSMVMKRAVHLVLGQCQLRFMIKDI